MNLASDSIAVVREAIRRWVALLSTGNFEDAARAITTADSPCSAGLLVEAIGSYSRKYRDAAVHEKAMFVPKITSPQEMDALGENMVIYVKHGVTIIEYDLPLENSWSDLTAKFRMTSSERGGADLSLIDIRVL